MTNVTLDYSHFVYKTTRTSSIRIEFYDALASLTRCTIYHPDSSHSPFLITVPEEDATMLMLKYPGLKLHES